MSVTQIRLPAAMMKIFFRPALTMSGQVVRVALLGGVLGFASTAIQAQPARNIPALYKELCANCHGADLRGGSARSLAEGNWNYGSDDATIARLIRDGDVEKGMPSFKAALSEAEIRAMVVLMREMVAQAKSATNMIAKPIDGEIVTSAEHKFRLRSVAENLETPWSIAFLPDDRILVTELPGRLRVIERGQLRPEPVRGTPPVFFRGQGGLMTVAVHPQYRENGWIYLAYSDPATNAGRAVSMTAIARGRIKDNQWADEQIIFRAAPESYLPTQFHFGCRLVFDEQGYLFFSIGERGVKEHAQDLSLPNGKIHRIHDDGRIPKDNPFVGQSNAVASIWSYGNRNAQGLARNPKTGDLWENEHGPRGGDELNLIQRGRNYGWPIITHGMDYNGTPITALTAKEGMEQPVIHWTPSIAVCGMDFYFGPAFPKWSGNLFVTALAQQELRRLVLDGHKVIQQEVLFKNIGRVRDVATGPDGFIYVALNGPSRIIRLEPAP
jgi:glucose/arabinose dehydrogenase